jgi:hypothetical protein
MGLMQRLFSHLLGGERRGATAPRLRRRQVMLEALEPRYAPATLGLGIRVLDDVGGTPGGPRTTPLQVNDTFWIQVLAEDQRPVPQTPQGIIALPLNLSWDSQNIELLNPPTSFSPNPIAPAELVTPDFTLNRAVNAPYDPLEGHFGFVEPPVGPVPLADPANLIGLRGAALPALGEGQAIGHPGNVGFFSLLRFRAIAAADDTPFSLRLAGSMSFADAAALDGVDDLSPALLQSRVDVGAPQVLGPQGPELQVTEFLEIDPIIVPQPSTVALSGFVYADTNVNGVRDVAADGTPLEIGLPNVQIQLFAGTQLVATTTTGPDGLYHFEGLPAGTYRIIEIQPAGFVNSLNSLGQILAPPAGGGGNPPNAAARRGVVSGDQFSAIELRGGEQAVDYNFGENVIPTKNELRARSIPRVSLNTRLGLRTAFVPATAADDNIDVQVSASEIAVTVNADPPRFFDRGTFDIVVIDCEGGIDFVSVTGTDEDEVAHFQPGETSLRVGADYAGVNYGLVAVGNEEAQITAGTGGDDLAIIRDTRGTSDALIAAANTATLTTFAGRLALAIDFDAVRAVTTLVPGGPEDDTVDANALAYILHLAGSWREI